MDQQRREKLSKDIDTNLVWLDIDAASIGRSTFVENGKNHGVALDGPLIVLHHQIDSQVSRDLVRLFDEILGVNFGTNDVSELEVLKNEGLAE